MRCLHSVSYTHLDVYKRQDRVTLTNLGADIARGTLTGNAQRNADGSWQVENLRLADIRLQSEKSLTDFFAPLRSVPSLQIGRLEVIDARLQGPDWAVTDLDLSLRNMTFSKDDWQTQEGKLSMNASAVSYTHLDVYKRQQASRRKRWPWRIGTSSFR